VDRGDLTRASFGPSFALLGRDQAGAAELALVALLEHPAIAAGDEDRHALGRQRLRVSARLAERHAAERDLHLPDEGVGAEGTRVLGAGVVAEHDDGVERTAMGFFQRRLGLVEGEVGDWPHLDPGRHPLAFDVGADHVPVADRDPPGARLAQRLDRDQDLIGHQSPAACVGCRMRGQAVAAVVDAGDALHVGGDQDVHGGQLSRLSVRHTSRLADQPTCENDRA